VKEARCKARALETGSQQTGSCEPLPGSTFKQQAGPLTTRSDEALDWIDHRSEGNSSLGTRASYMSQPGSKIKIRQPRIGHEVKSSGSDDPDRRPRTLLTHGPSSQSDLQRNNVQKSMFRTE